MDPPISYKILQQRLHTRRPQCRPRAFCAPCGAGQSALLYGDALDLQRCVLGQFGHLHRAAGGVGLGEELTIHLVHLGEVVDVRQKHGGFYHVGQGHALLGQNGLDVLQRLGRLGGDALGEGAGGGVQRQLAGNVNGFTGGNALRVGADGGGSLIGSKYLFQGEVPPLLLCAKAFDGRSGRRRTEKRVRKRTKILTAASTFASILAPEGQKVNKRFA